MVMSPFTDVFSEIAALLAIASAAGALAVWLRQPLITAFIAVGILVGPAGLGWVVSSDQVTLFAKLGIALLLFVVGLKLDPHEVRSVGPVAIAAGLTQIGLTGGLGYLLAWQLGLPPVAAFYIAMSLTFSSTIIIVKLLSDRREIDALHGRIAVGVLIVQDIVVVMLMICLAAFSDTNPSASLLLLLSTVVFKGLLFLGCVVLITRYLLPQLLHNLARSVELLILFAIAWALTLGAVAEALGFSQEVGAFLAGVALAATPYRAILASRLVSLRDFLLLFFFIDLGTHIDIGHLGAQIWPALLLSALVLLGKPLIVMVLMGVMGYRKYTSALTSFTLGQISEFSLILGALGVSLGHIDESVRGLIILVGLITIGLSTYIILYSHQLYRYLSSWLNLFERNVHHQNLPSGDLVHFKSLQVDVILFGLGRYGGSVVQDLRLYGLSVLGVDFDPEVVAFWRRDGLHTLYGDADDPEFAAALPLEQAQWVVSTIPGRDIGLTLLHAMEHHGFQGRLAVTSHVPGDIKLLQEAGADVVLCPFRDAAQEAARLLATWGNRPFPKPASPYLAEDPIDPPIGTDI